MLQQPEIALVTIKKFQRELGDSYNFTFWNPTGHYFFNLTNKSQREVAKCLILLNKSNNEAAIKNEIRDRS
jgi:hypothetical protein